MIDEAFERVRIHRRKVAHEKSTQIPISKIRHEIAMIVLVVIDNYTREPKYLTLLFTCN